MSYQAEEVCFKRQRRNEHAENKQSPSHCSWRGERRDRKNWWGVYSHLLQHLSPCLFPGGWCCPTPLPIRQLSGTRLYEVLLQLLLVSWKTLTQRSNQCYFRGHRINGVVLEKWASPKLPLFRSVPKVIVSSCFINGNTFFFTSIKGNALIWRRHEAIQDTLEASFT